MWLADALGLRVRGAFAMWLRRRIGTVVARCICDVVAPAHWDCGCAVHLRCGCAGALGLWLRGLRCVMVLAEVVGIKGASRPCGLEQVRPLTPTTSAREGRSYADPALTCEQHRGIPFARVVPV
jgi:hypothetical protein